MFTGIVEEVGTVARSAGGHLVIEASTVLEGTRVGDSISVNGCCLTVTSIGPGWWSAEAVAETLARTTLGGLGAGARVNLERPVTPEGRMGGHIVQGHVDAVGTVVATDPLLTVELPAGLGRYVVEKGSIALDGVSLTVVSVADRGGPEAPTEVSAAVIPHTAEATVLGALKVGDAVNVETDVLAKHVERLIATGRT